MKINALIQNISFKRLKTSTDRAQILLTNYTQVTKLVDRYHSVLLKMQRILLTKNFKFNNHHKERVKVHASIWQTVKGRLHRTRTAAIFSHLFHTSQVASFLRTNSTTAITTITITTV